MTLRIAPALVLAGIPRPAREPVGSARLRMALVLLSVAGMAAGGAERVGSVILRVALVLLSVVGIAAAEEDAAALLSRIVRYEPSQPRNDLAQFEAAVRSATSSPARLRELESGLVRLLDGPSTTAAKDFACRQLSLIGTAASVPALARLLGRTETTGIAFYALSRIPGDAAGKALREALPRIEAIQALGARRDPTAVPALREIARSSDPPAASAAVAALGKIGTTAALDALASVAGKTSGQFRIEVSQARLEAAWRASSLDTFRQLSAPSEPWPIRIAALSGISSIRGPSAIEGELKSADPRIQAHVLALLPTAVLVKRFQDLPPLAQVRAITALAARGDREARPLLTTALASSDPGVRLAALTGLGAIGDASSVKLLAEAAAKSAGPEQEAARESLYVLSGADVDAAVVSGIATAPGGVKLELIRAAGERSATEAVDALFLCAADPDRQVRREAFRALRETTGPEHVAPLLALVVNAKTAADRTEAARPLAGALKRSDANSLRTVLAACSASAAPALRATLLDVLGQAGNSGALPLLRTALHDENGEVRRAAILALSNWPTGEPLGDLLALAQKETDPARQILALRGLLNLVAIPSERSYAETARLLGTALSLARQNAEKLAVLALLPKYPCKEALDVAEVALRDKSILEEARLAYGRVSRAMAKPK